MYDIINSVTVSLYELGEYGRYDYPDRIGSDYCRFLSYTAEGQEHFIFNGKTSLLVCFCRCIGIISNAVKCGCECRILLCMV